MSIQDLSDFLRSYSWILLAWFTIVPLVTWLYGRTHRKESGHLGVHRRFYQSLIFVTCVPGVFSFVLTCYTLLIVRGNLLEVNIFVYFLPLISMVATLMVMRNKVDLRQVPGYNKLIGLIIILVAVFSILFLLMNTRIFVFFGGSFMILLLIGVALFGLIWYGWKRFKKNK